MRVDKIGKTSRLKIIEQMRDVLDPWVSDGDLVNKIDEDTNLTTDLGLDSIGILQVILGTEKLFGISIENHELDSETFSMMGNLVSIIEKKLYEDNRPTYK